MSSELCALSVAGLAAGIRGGDFSSEEVVAAHLARIEETTPQINAVVARRAEAALDDARAADKALAAGDGVGPLHGVPCTIKDCFDTAGLVTTYATAGRKDFVPERDATAVARVKGAGAIVMGKTNAPEVGVAFETSNALFGATLNPYNTGHSVGGSSGGAAANVAVGGAPFEVGSDTGGSIRLPAAWCGVAGLKTTRGRVPLTGHSGGLEGPLGEITAIGPIARCVSDLALLLPIMAGQDLKDPHSEPGPDMAPGKVDVGALRIGLMADNGIVGAEPEIAAAVNGAAKHLSGVCKSLGEVVPDGVADTLSLFMRLFWGDGGASLRHMLDAYGTGEPGEIVAKTLEAAKGMKSTPEEIYATFQELGRYRVRMAAVFEDFDAIVSPVVPWPALDLGAATSSRNIPGFSYTMAYNLTGWPALSLPMGLSKEGLPLAVQVAAAPWREDIVLALGAVLEETFGGWRAPPI